MVNLEDEAAFADAELEYSHRILAAAAYESWTPFYVKANNFAGDGGMELDGGL